MRTQDHPALWSSAAALLLWACHGGPTEPAPPPAAPPTPPVTPTPAPQSVQPAPEPQLPTQVFFGDTHLHTSYSTDAGMVGDRLGPEEAYRFARGEVVKASAGLDAKLERALDFLVVADHAENLGLAPLIAEKDAGLLSTEFGKKIAQLVYDGKYGAAYALWGSYMGKREDPLKGQDALTRSIWHRLTAAAEKYNEPGRFTALIGFEWTSSPGGNNLHRNVIFRDGKALADQIVPISNYDTTDPEKLWEWMQAYEAKTGGKLLAIPHNGNLSNGLMFDDVTLTTKRPFDRSYAERRQRWEPLYEVTQIKGDGEAHPALSPNDEFADYGTWDKGSFGPEPKTPDMLPREYAREALKRGMKYEQELGANPFKFGMIGSTDSHTSLATVDEDNFFGKATLTEPNAKGRFDEKVTGYAQKPGGPDITMRHYRALASGLAAVWAVANTREALWDALARKEVYATTGTRVTLRVFAGWDFKDGDLAQGQFVQAGYGRGVPMGGDLRGARGDAPTIMVQAMKDAAGANLDRVQIVKGWLDADGKTHEKVYDVACGGRKITGHHCEPVTSTVDVAKATYTNDVGAANLSVVWNDPEFKAAEPAFYYIRVLEIPTPTWILYDKVQRGLEPPKDAPTTQQERACGSPIWYYPS